MNDYTKDAAQPQKFAFQSAIPAAEKHRHLKQLFHKAFVETQNQPTERYGLSRTGKSECQKITQQPSVATLKPCRTESVRFDSSQNLFIKGDNLEALKLLQKSYYGKVRMIYIDPPYNTGKRLHLQR